MADMALAVTGMVLCSPTLSHAGVFAGDEPEFEFDPVCMWGLPVTL